VIFQILASRVLVEAADKRCRVVDEGK
jgi:hypothetical protein